MEGYGEYGGPRGPRTTAPVSVGEELTATVEAVGEKGDGIVKKKGFVLFVPGVKEGQSVKVRVTKVLRKVGFAEVIGPSEPSAKSESHESSEESSEEENADDAGDDGSEESGDEDSEDFGDDSEN